MESISAQEVLSWVLAPGDVYWMRSSGSSRIVNTGQIVNQELISKFQNKNVLQVDFKFSTQKEIIESLINLFKNLQNEKFEANKVQISKKILKNFFLSETENIPFLEILYTCQRSFYSFTPEQTEKLRAIDLALFQRSSLVSGLIVYLALGLGYLDFSFLKDLYHTCYLIDYGFSHQQVSTTLLKALEEDRRSEINGIEFLEEKGLKSECFKNHPVKGNSMAKDDFNQIIVNKELFSLITLHHENFDGTGFPLRLNEKDLLDLETLFILINKLTSYEWREIIKGEGKDFVEKSLINPTLVHEKRHSSKRLGLIIKDVRDVILHKEWDL